MTHRISKLSRVTLACLGAAASMAAGTATAQIDINVRLDQAPIRSIDRQAFGSQFVFSNADIRVMFTNVGGNGVAVDTCQAYQYLRDQSSKGMVRFPGGTPALHYYWNAVGYSWTPPQFNLNPIEFWTPDELTTLIQKPPTSVLYDCVNQLPRPSMGAQALIQTNTYASWLNNAFKKILVQTNGVNSIDNAALDQAAEVAGLWVKHNRENANGSFKPLTEQTEYWEIGNEDWVYWTPQQYAQIVKKFVDRMEHYNGGSIAASSGRKALKFLVQGTVENGWANPTGGITFIQDLATALGPTYANKIHGVSLHSYYDGGGASTLEQRTYQNFSDVDGLPHITYARINLLNAGVPWRLLVTEYNLSEATADQTKAHGMVFADWTMSMLTKGVDTVIPLSMDTNTGWAMFQYRNDGGTLTNPILMPPGAAYAALAQYFKGALYKVDNNSPYITSGPRAVSSYASYSGNTMTVLLINRDLTNARTVNVKITGSKSFGAATSFSIGDFTGSYAQSNKNQSASNPPVRWSYSSGSVAQTCVTSPAPRICTLTPSITIPAGSMRLLHLPVQ